MRTIDKVIFILIGYCIALLLALTIRPVHAGDCPDFTDESILEVRLFTSNYHKRFIASRQPYAAYLEQDLGAITQFANIEYEDDGWKPFWSETDDAPIIKEAAYYIWVYDDDYGGADWLVQVFHSSLDSSVDYPAFYDLNNKNLPGDGTMHPNCWLKTDSMEYIEFIELVTAQYESWQAQLDSGAIE